MIIFITLHKLITKNMKINYQLVIAFIVISYMIGSTIFGYKMYQEFQRTSANQTILLQQVDGLQKERQLVLTPNEFKKTLDSTTTSMMKDIGIKVKNVENYVKMSSTAGGTVSFVPRDTIISRNDTLVQASVLDHKEKFLTMKGLVMKDSASITWSTRDSLNILLYWKREGKFLPKIFGKKIYEGNVKGINPYIKYTIDKNIKVSKK